MARRKRSKWWGRVRRGWRKAVARRKRIAAQKRKAATAAPSERRRGLGARVSLQAHRWVAEHQAGREMERSARPRWWESQEQAAQRTAQARERLRDSDVTMLNEAAHRERLRRFDRRHRFTCSAHNPPLVFASAADLNQHLVEGHPEPVRHPRGQESRPRTSPARLPNPAPRSPAARKRAAATTGPVDDKPGEPLDSRERARQERLQRERQAYLERQREVKHRQAIEREQIELERLRLLVQAQRTRQRYEEQRESRAERERREVREAEERRQLREAEERQAERERVERAARAEARKRAAAARAANGRLPDSTTASELATKAKLIKLYFNKVREEAVRNVGASDATTTLKDIGSMPVTTVSQIREIAVALEAVANSLQEAVVGFRQNARTSEQAPIKEEVLTHLQAAESGAEEIAAAVIRFISAFDEEYGPDIAAARAGERMDNTALTN